MVETFTPAVCGSRSRQRLALALFAAAAVGTSMIVGAALGALGAILGLRLTLAAAALALIAAGREAGILRVPIPQSRRQVPEAWRAERPLPFWSVGYGAGLGAGFLTFQPVSTFWVACAGAIALGRPLAAAMCFGAYGAGRALMAAWPRRGQADATAAVEALVARRRLLLGVNVAVLVACAALLSAPAAGAGTTSLGPGLDPSAAGSVLARARMDTGQPIVVVQEPGTTAVTVNGAAAPAVDGDLLAYDDDQGIEVIDWRSGATVARVNGPVAKPALDWPLLAYVRTDSDYKRLVLADFTDPGAPVTRAVARVGLGQDLGRPSLAGGRIAWHKVRGKGSDVFVQVLASGRRARVAHSVIGVVSNPSLTASRVVWVDQRSAAAALRVHRFGRRGARTIYRITGRTRLFWTTALVGRTAYVARWARSTGASTLIRVNF
jgi:hypothetical protein